MCHDRFQAFANIILLISSKETRRKPVFLSGQIDFFWENKVVR
jgi:hypothetical protein